jgi:type II secretory pathway component PulF
MDKINLTFRAKWSRRDIILLLERLELYISAGLPLGRALEVAGGGISKRQAAAIAKVRESVEAGGLLSSALVRQLRIAGTTTSLIEQGERSGQLAAALTTATGLLERQDELTKKCFSAMLYPAVIGIFASLLTIGLVRGVMPQIIPMLLSLNDQLPLITRVVIFISQGFLAYGIYVAGGIVIAGIGMGILVKKITAVRAGLQAVLLHLPIVGSLMRDFALVSFLRSCGSLVETGMPVKAAFDAVVHGLPLIPLRRRLQVKGQSLSGGIPLGQVLGALHIPRFVAPIIMAGEASGTLGVSLTRAATILDRSMEHSLKKLTSLIEPLMMAGMGTVVGGIALSIMMPIYDISRVLQH